MCGIAGFVSPPRLTEVDAHQAVQRMTARMSRRGPDADGFWSGDNVVLGHRRLAIVDLDPRADQPLISADGRYAIVFNGEIYNFRELRRELEADGIAFRTTSDTEVLLALFARDSEHMLPLLRGMFAFAIWDTQTRELFLARDPYGIKPLYYTQTRHGLVFASQVKALLESGLVSSACEPAGWAGFYLWGSVPEPWTLYRDVFALMPGHCLWVRGGVADAPVCWHDIRRHWQSEGHRVQSDELQATVRQAVLDSVRAHLVADVPVSVFLSGGIDSAVVAGLAAELGARVDGITIGFEEFAGQHNDEVPMARLIAAHYGIKHHVRMISRAEFEQDVPHILAAMDQPSIDGVNTWFASKVAAERGYKVALSGIGGDELFCGYSLFRQIPRHAALARALAVIPGATTLLRGPFSALGKWRSQPKLGAVPDFAGSLEGMYFLRRCLFLPDELPALLGMELAREGLARLGSTPPGMAAAMARDPLAAVGLLESTHYLRNQLLPDCDWAAMAHSLELRTPLVDVKLLETCGPYVAGFSNGAGKAMLAASPKNPLPDAVVNRVKTGFSLPMAAWLVDSLHMRTGADLPAHTSWARRWAQTVLAGSA